LNTLVYVKVKGKIHPVTCHEGTEDEYNCTVSLTSALVGGGG